LQESLNAGAAGETRFHVTVGMQHSAPWIADGFKELAAAGVASVVGVIMSPQYSPIIMGGYLRRVEEAKAVLGPGAEVRVAGDWHMLPAYLDAVAARIHEALARLPADERERIPIIMTAHSLPKSVVDREPGYITALKETARGIAERARLPEGRWRFCYQSAGHTPEEWLKPDVKELFPVLKKQGHDSVLIVPTQFLTDHLEVLYDIDIAGGGEAREAGVRMLRTESLNTSTAFISALAGVVLRELRAPGPSHEAGSRIGN
jgi:ferrochelatase